MPSIPIITNDFSWKIAGAAGDGILNAGLLGMAKTALRNNLYVFATAEYPSLIRGGHNHLDLRISDRPLNAHTQELNLLLALNEESVTKHAHKITPGGGIIYDVDVAKSLDVTPYAKKGVSVFPIPITTMAFEAGGKIMRNSIGIGASLALVGLTLEEYKGVLESVFGKKGDAVVQKNIQAAQRGYDYIHSHFPQTSFRYRLTRCEKKKEEKDRIFVSGNEAISIGAIKAGCTFYAAYPMTPASSILTVLAENEKKFGMVVKHTEDEIAAINMAIGASYAGSRAMVGTSGGGFALMVESFGLAAMTETPLVVVEAMRPGPATGMATHSGQGDLRFLLHAGTDEFPRLIVAPGDFDECYTHTLAAFNLAEKYQLPAIVLTDKYLGESYSTISEPDQNVQIDRGSTILNGNAPLDEKGEYLRYRHTPNGVSPRTVPGVKGGMHVASSYEHDEHGFEREEEDNRIRMHQKRYQKFATLANELPQPVIIGPANADYTLIGWGSTKGPILEAMRLLEKEKISVNYLQIAYISPFPKKTVEKILRAAKKTILVENTLTAQMAGIIREETGLAMDETILKYDGRPFSPEGIAERVRMIAQSKKGVQK